MNSETTKKDPLLPLEWLVDRWLAIGSWFSPHFWIFGKNPNAHRPYFNNHWQVFNYHTFHDLYIIGSWCFSAFLIFKSPEITSWWTATFLMAYCTLRLHELFLSLARTSLSRAKRQHRPHNRTFGMAVSAYTEPILLFGVCHACLPVLLESPTNFIYSISSISWNLADLLHYSVSTYTSIGYALIFAKEGASRILSSAETLFGMMMLIFTISNFVSKLDGP